MTSSAKQSHYQHPNDRDVNVAVGQKSTQSTPKRDDVEAVEFDHSELSCFGCDESMDGIFGDLVESVLEVH